MTEAGQLLFAQFPPYFSQQGSVQQGKESQAGRPQGRGCACPSQCPGMDVAGGNHPHFRAMVMLKKIASKLDFFPHRFMKKPACSCRWLAWIQGKSEGKCFCRRSLPGSSLGRHGHLMLPPPSKGTLSSSHPFPSWAPAPTASQKHLLSLRTISPSASTAARAQEHQIPHCLVSAAVL